MRASWPERPVVFDCRGDALIGVLHQAEEVGGGTGVLIVVGGPQYRVGSHRQFLLMGRALASVGYPVFRFDYRGMGDSDGTPRTFEAVGEDIKAAIDAFFAEEPQMQGVVLWGLCDAASAALMYRPDRRVKGFVLANPWVRTAAAEAQTYLRHYYLQRVLQPSFWRKLFSGAFGYWKSAADLMEAVRHARGSRANAFIDSMLEGLRRFPGPVLVLVSERDLTAQAFVDLCAADPKWRDAVSSPRVRIARLPGADHTFSNRSALSRATEETTVWLAQVTL